MSQLPEALYLHDLDTAATRLHLFFDRWIGERASTSVLSEDALYRAKLAAHEWVANLVQHADFESRAPVIVVRLRKEGNRLRCTIEDNSTGFNLERQLQDNMHEQFARLPERGMGLLMIKASATHFDYSTVDEDRQRLTFSISSRRKPTKNGAVAPVQIARRARV